MSMCVCACVRQCLCFALCQSIYLYPPSLIKSKFCSHSLIHFSPDCQVATIWCHIDGS